MGKWLTCVFPIPVKIKIDSRNRPSIPRRPWEKVTPRIFNGKGQWRGDAALRILRIGRSLCIDGRASASRRKAPGQTCRQPCFGGNTMTDRKIEKSPSGANIIRYTQRTKPAEFSGGSPDIEKIEEHIQKYIGSYDFVYHEIISDLVHLDVHIVKPNANRNYYTLITSGMSDRPMKALPKMEPYRYSELLICLPPDWSLTDDAMKEEKNYWPVRQLKSAARFPHAYDAWLWYGHTIPNGDPPQPFDKSTKLSGILVVPPLLAPKEFHTLKIDDNKTIYFFSIVPLYTEEMKIGRAHV
jgi:hypothetical protein